MSIDVRIGIIGGTGWLGSAIAKAVVETETIDPARLTLSSRSGDGGKLEVTGAYWTSDNSELVRRSDIIVLSVRPEQYAGVDIDARGKLVISVMAGIPARLIAERTKASALVRSIPNAAAAIRRSFTPWYATSSVDAGQKQIVQALFEACGDAAEVTLESHVDYCVGMTGSGAAFPALIAQAMILHAIARGLPADFAKRAAKGVIAGASQLFAGEEADIQQIVQEMIDYRGTTAAALQTMTDHGLMDAVAAGLDAAMIKAATMAPN